MVATGALIHEAFCYSDVDEFLDGIVPFVRAGIDADEPVLVAVPPRRLSLLRESLAATKVHFVDMAEKGRNPNLILPLVLTPFIDEHRPKRVRIVAESLYADRTPEEIPPCVQHEALVNVAFADVDATIRCPVNVTRMPHLVPYVERTHPVVVTREGRPRSTTYMDPETVVALLNQPLRDSCTVDDSMIFNETTLASVRQRVGKFADEAGLDAARVTDLQIAVNEIATNAVIHANRGPASLRMWADGDRVVCEISGGGEIVDIMAGRVVPAPDSPRGRGLLIANRLCDLVQTYTGPTGTVTRLHMRLPASDSSPAG